MQQRRLAVLLLILTGNTQAHAQPPEPRDTPRLTFVSDIARLGPKTRPLPKTMWPLRSGEPLKLHYPLPFLAKEASPYGWRFSEHRDRWRLHTGHDLIAPSGTDVLAALSGRALMVQPVHGYGLTVLLDHGNGWQTLYAHLLRTQISPGQFVTTGEPIGNVGASGNASTSHLHFELRRVRDGQTMAIDPAPLLDQ